ncbi:MAG: hypothetical protein FJX29_15780, partial [Alphaproteobacteria bacterium]|nr:hypothetical protein [Alphaproteobacteria bacterium]
MPGGVLGSFPNTPAGRGRHARSVTSFSPGLQRTVAREDVMSDITRRSLLAGTPAVLAAGLLPNGTALAQESASNYPSREIKFICAFPAGSGADVYVRWFADRMRPIMKRNIIVENRAGANGNIATTYTARARPDGYTIYVHAPSALAANMHLFRKPPVDVAKEIQV